MLCVLRSRNRQHASSAQIVRSYSADRPQLVTLGWDNRINVWDPRSPRGEPAIKIQLPMRGYAMDCAHGNPYLFVATATRKPSVGMYDTRVPSAGVASMVRLLR